MSCLAFGTGEFVPTPSHLPAKHAKHSVYLRTTQADNDLLSNTN